MPESPRATPSDDEGLVTAALQSELQRTYDRIDEHNANTIAVIQYMVLVFGGGIAATLKYSWAFTAVPVFWSVWFLHALLLDQNTLKAAARAEALEHELNTRLLDSAAGVERIHPYGWESTMTARLDAKPLIYAANYALWMTVNVGSWIIAVVFLLDSHHPYMVIPVAALWSAVYGVAGYTVARRSHYAAAYREAASEALSPMQMARSEPTAVAHALPNLG